MPLPPLPPPPPTRREMLRRCAGGFGGVALATLFGRSAAAAGGNVGGNNVASDGPRHHPARARSVIFLYMDGGVSAMDTFDPKPRLRQEDGKPFGMKMEPTQFNDNGAVLGSPWRFRRYGQSGIEVSDLFPHVATCVDDLAIVRSMVADFSEHTNANYFLHTGHGLQGRPSMGAWVGYGLGSESRDLPDFMVLNGGLIPPGGIDNFGNGFLPASHQGSVFRSGGGGVANIAPLERDPSRQRDKLALRRRLEAALLDRLGHHDALESAIENHETAFRMQAAVPELLDLTGESAATRRLYGLDAAYPHTRTFGEQCLLARRLVERGVRFIELTVPNTGHDRWDQHSALQKGHADNARATDQPIAGLLTDLKRRGLLDETLVVWAGEFGRTPFAQGRDGRDHNPFGFTIWLAGGGIRGGVVHGATDDYGYKVVQDPVKVHDLHATMLHLLGVDHTRLTFRHSGRDIRLTDVYGEVVQPILA